MPLSLIWACISGLLFALNDGFSHFRPHLRFYKRQLAWLIIPFKKLRIGNFQTTDITSEGVRPFLVHSRTSEHRYCK